MNQAAGVTIEPNDILEIHSIQGEQGRIRPVIAKLRNSDSKIKIIKHRSKDGVIFISCQKIHTLWSDLSLYVYRKTSERVGFNMSNIILGQHPLSFHMLRNTRKLFIATLDQSLISNKTQDF